MLKYVNMVIFLFSTGMLLTGCGPAQETREQPAAQTEAPAAATSESATNAMELLETNQSATQDAITIVGRVKNNYSRDVSGVAVYCDFQDANGSSIRIEQGSLQTDPLSPNAISEFRINTPYNSAIKRFNVTFAEMFGGKLVTKDSRKQ
ncbi:MAG: hypothetical protein HY313_10245 [Acidobacteria bacterium]|nr:hypothetical protein [Acidobacteriota bacterium]